MYVSDECVQNKWRALSAGQHQSQLQSSNMEHSQSAANGILHAQTHPFPNNDLRNFGEKNGWPSRLFGEKRSQALIAANVTTFSQLVSEVKSRTKEEFYRDFGTCDGKVGALDTAANTMYDVVLAWAAARGGSSETDTDAWLMHADTHGVPDEDLSLGASGGWPKGAMGPERIAKLKALGITRTSKPITKSYYDRFVADYGGRDGALDVRASGFFGFLHRVHAANA
jgi:hypothetical protein